MQPTSNAKKYGKLVTAKSPFHAFCIIEKMSEGECKYSLFQLIQQKMEREKPESQSCFVSRRN